MTTKDRSSEHDGDAGAEPKKQPKQNKRAEQAAEAKPAAEGGPEAKAEKAAEKKEPKERRFVDAKTGRTIEKPKQGGSGAEATQAVREEMHAERSGKALPFRIAAIVLWALGVACEVVAILTANGTLFLPGPSQMTWLIIWIVADLALVIAGSQLWKRANHIAPASKDNKAAYWVQTDLGIIIAVIAFAPIILLMLSNKNLDKKTKQVCSIVAGVALVAAIGSGIDYHPATQEDLDQAEAGAAVLSDDGLAYWTPFGKKYHFNPDCQYLKNSGTIYSGTVQDAIDAGRNEGCSGCTVEGGTDVLSNADPDAVAAVAANAISLAGEDGGEASSGYSNDDSAPADDSAEDEDLPKAA